MQEISINSLKCDADFIFFRNLIYFFISCNEEYLNWKRIRTVRNIQKSIVIKVYKKIKQGFNICTLKFYSAYIEKIGTGYLKFRVWRGVLKKRKKTNFISLHFIDLYQGTVVQHSRKMFVLYIFVNKTYFHHPRKLCLLMTFFLLFCLL